MSYALPASAIYSDGADVIVVGDLTVSGNDLKCAAGTVLSFDSPTLNVTVASNLIFADGKAVLDANANELIVFQTIGSAVNYFDVSGAATGGNPIFLGTGSDTNVGIDFQGKGTGSFNFKSTSDSAAEVRLFEDTDDGTNYAGLKAGAMAASVTWTLPIADGSANQVIKTDGSGVLGWATAGSGTVTSITPAADSGTGTAITGSGTLTISGTSNEVETSVSGTTITVGLPNDVTLTGDLTVGGGDIKVSGGTVITMDGGLDVTLASNLKFADGKSIQDANGAALLTLETVSGNVNGFDVTGAATGSDPILGAIGSDANIGLSFQGKGTGVFNFKSTSDAAAEIRLFEDTDDGSNYAGLKSGTMGASVTWTLPTADGSANQVLKTDGSGALGWADNTAVPSMSVISASATLASFTNTTVVDGQSAAVALTLPAISSASDTGKIMTIKGTNSTASNNITITPDSGLIDAAATYVLKSDNQAVRLAADYNSGSPRWFAV